MEFHIHHAKEAARIAKIVSLLDQKTGKASKSAPRFLKAKQSAVVEVSLISPLRPTIKLSNWATQRNRDRHDLIPCGPFVNLDIWSII